MPRRENHPFSLALLVLVTACSDEPPARDTGIEHEGGDSSDVGVEPYRDEWRTVHLGPFAALDDEGDPAITDVLVGSALGYADNFVNRGDVIVQFDGPPDTIEIEFRRFTFAEDAADASEIFERLHLWAFNESVGSPKMPRDMDEAARCGGPSADDAPVPWQDGCAIYVYYDGQAQLARAGADIRVTLPSDYRQRVSISTSDNVVEDSYPNHGNVCVSGLVGELDVELQSGVAYVTVAADTAYPGCPAELVADCEAFDDPSTPGPDAWSKDCGCIAQGYNPGIVTVAALEPSSTDIVVDVPASLWTSFRAENAGANLLGGKHCTATVDDFDDVAFDEGTDDPNKPWLRGGIANRPPAAPAGGFRVDLRSSGCEAVGAVEEPSAWADDVDDPPPQLRGNLEICAGCLAAQTCETLLPGA